MIQPNGFIILLQPLDYETLQQYQINVMAMVCTYCNNIRVIVCVYVCLYVCTCMYMSAYVCMCILCMYVCE